MPPAATPPPDAIDADIMDAAMLPAAIPVGVKPAAATVAGTATSAPTAPAAAAAAGAATPAAAAGATPDEGEPVTEPPSFALPVLAVRLTTAGVKGFSPAFLPAIAACVLQPCSSPEFRRPSHFARPPGARPPATRQPPAAGTVRAAEPPWSGERKRCGGLAPGLAECDARWKGRRHPLIGMAAARSSRHGGLAR